MATSIEAVILAAGKGSRLGAITENIPKCLVEVEGKAILGRQLEILLREPRIGRVTIAVGYKRQHIDAFLANHFPGERIRALYVPDFAQRNTANSLLCALEDWGGSTPILQLNGDVIFDPPIIDMLLSSSEATSSMCMLRDRCGEEEMKARTAAGADMIIEIGKGLHPALAYGEAFGINLYHPKFVRELIPALSEAVSRNWQAYYEDAIHVMLPDAKIRALDAAPHRAVEIDFPEDLVRARTILCSPVSSSPVL